QLCIDRGTVITTKTRGSISCQRMDDSIGRHVSNPFAIGVGYIDYPCAIDPNPAIVLSEVNAGRGSRTAVAKKVRQAIPCGCRSAPREIDVLHAAVVLVSGVHTTGVDREGADFVESRAAIGWS